MKRKRKSKQKTSKLRGANQAPSRTRSVKVLDAEQRAKLAYSLPSTSAHTQLDPTLPLTDRSASLNVPGGQSEILRGKTPRLLPFLDVVTRRASNDAASVVDIRISRDAIHQHPSRSDVLLVSPSCGTCIRLGVVCDRAAGTCGSCGTLGTRCCYGRRWDLVDAVTGQEISDQDLGKASSPTADIEGKTGEEKVIEEKAVNLEGKTSESKGRTYDDEPKKVKPAVREIKIVKKKAELEGNDQGATPELQCFFWASSLLDMRQCDPLFPSTGTSIGTSRNGSVTALVLDRQNLQWPSRLENLVAIISTDDSSFSRLETASTAGIPFRLYYLFDDQGRPCRVANDSVARAKVVLLGICTIRSIERRGDKQAHLSLGLTSEQRHRADPQGTTNGIQQTFLGFRCNTCGKANRKTHWNLDSCLHCSTPVALSNKAVFKALSRRRKMELCFTGPRSDLGQAYVLLTDDDLIERSVASFDDGTRVCSYHFQSPTRNGAFDSSNKQQFDKSALHHVLRPGRSGKVSLEAIATPSTPFKRLSLEEEAKFRIRGYSLCFGTQDQDTRTAIAAECLPFSLASLEVAKHVATLRESIQLANVAIRAGETMMIPSGCLYLLFENGRMRINPSFLPPSSTYLGILCLTEATSVTFSREGRPESASSTADRQQKDVSLGSFVMQPHDAIVGRTELFEAVELELSSSGISLWAIAQFDAAEATETDRQPPQRNGGAEDMSQFAVQEHQRPWCL